MIVHGPEPVIEAGNGPADAHVSFWITTYPGRVEFVAWGADQPAGTTSLNWPVDAPFAVTLTVNALPVLPATAVVGEIVTFSGGFTGAAEALITPSAAAMANTRASAGMRLLLPQRLLNPHRPVNRGVDLIPFPFLPKLLRTATAAAQVVCYSPVTAR